MSKSIWQTISGILALLALGLASCAPADIGARDTAARGRLHDGVWSVQQYMLADGRAEGQWALEAGGRTAYANIDTARRVLTLVMPDGERVEFDYLQVDYGIDVTDYSENIALALRDRTYGTLALFRYNLHRGRFMLEWGPIFVNGHIHRNGSVT